MKNKNPKLIRSQNHLTGEGEQHQSQRKRMKKKKLLGRYLYSLNSKKVKGGTGKYKKQGTWICGKNDLNFTYQTYFQFLSPHHPSTVMEKKKNFPQGSKLVGLHYGGTLLYH